MHSSVVRELHVAGVMRQLARDWSVRDWAVLACLCLGAGIQGFGMARGQVLSILDDLRGVDDRPAVERSAYLAFGEEFGEFVSFIRDNVPDSALVAIPPSEISTTYGHNGLMQYFLLPRRVTNCPSVETFDNCARNLAGPSTYILRVRGFPAAIPSAVGKEYLALRNGFGVYAPASVEGR